MKKFFTAALFFICCKAFSQQPSELENIIKQLQSRELLPVRKQPAYITAIYSRKNGKIVVDSAFRLPPSPLYPLYYTPEDEQLLSNLASSVRVYMAELDDKKKKQKQ